MDTDSELAIVRRAYAEQVVTGAGIADGRIQDAYAAVPREHYLGPGPWQMYQPPDGYVATPDANPAHVYVNRVVGLVAERSINNGQPSLHAWLMAAAQIGSGKHAVHVGAGTGYYSALMAHPSVRATKSPPSSAIRCWQGVHGIAWRVLRMCGCWKQTARVRPSTQLT